MKKLLRTLLVATVVAGSAVAIAPPASAVCWHVHRDGTPEAHTNDADCHNPPQKGALVVVGTATLPTFPCAPNCTGGTFSSTVAAGATANGALVTGVTASFNYDEACLVVPLLGSASGTLHIATSAGSFDTRFAWYRVGLVAVITGDPGTVIGAAVFVPNPLPACGSSSPVNATVAGAGLLL